MKKILIVIISFIFMINVSAFEVDINSDYAFVYNVKENRFRGVAQFGGNKRDRCRWQIKGAIVGAAVKIFRGYSSE